MRHVKHAAAAAFLSYTPVVAGFLHAQILDWDYYIERLGSAIQKIITIPAALQQVRLRTGGNRAQCDLKATETWAWPRLTASDK